MNQIILKEYDQRVQELDSVDAELLSRRFAHFVTIDKYGDKQYKLTTSHFVGIIVLQNNILIINPKIDSLSISYMFSYAYDSNYFRPEDFEYVKKYDESLFDYIIRNLLRRIETLCRKGISKTYYEIEENLPYLKGKVLITKNIILNQILQNRIYCNYSDFGPDTLENQIIKYTLYQLLEMRFGNKDLRRLIKLLLHYFEPVSMISSSRFVNP